MKKRQQGARFFGGVFLLWLSFFQFLPNQGNTRAAFSRNTRTKSSFFQYISLILLLFSTHTKRMRSSKMQAFANHVQTHPVNDREFRRRMSPIRRCVEERKSIRESRFSCGFTNQGCMRFMAGLQTFHGRVCSGTLISHNFRSRDWLRERARNSKATRSCPALTLIAGNDHGKPRTARTIPPAWHCGCRRASLRTELAGAAPTASRRDTAGDIACWSRSAFAPGNRHSPARRRRVSRGRRSSKCRAQERRRPPLWRLRRRAWSVSPADPNGSRRVPRSCEARDGRGSAS